MKLGNIVLTITFIENCLDLCYFIFKADLNFKENEMNKSKETSSGLDGGINDNFFLCNLFVTNYINVIFLTCKNIFREIQKGNKFCSKILFIFIFQNMVDYKMT